MRPSEKRPSNALSISQLREIDRICESFERAWVSGTAPKIEDFIGLPNEDTLAVLWQELMLIELQRLRAKGLFPTLEEYCHRFPGQADLIRPEWFDDAADDLPKLSAAQSVCGYTFRRELGRGGSGVVWLASDETLGRDVALKFFTSARDLKRKHGSALHEARVAALLDHPHIVPVYGMGSYQGWDYIATKYIPGQPLHKWCQAANPDFEQVAHLVVHMAEAIHYAHERGVTHRDLKPGNVIIDRQGLPYITDLGLAKSAKASGDLTASGQLMGTQGYMSPEQAMGKSNRADHRSDIYSLGVILYELLTGVKPFRGEFLEVLQATLSKNPVPPRQLNSAIPQPLEDICLKCLRKNPALRYASAKELAGDLQSFLDEQARASWSMPRLEAARDVLYVHRRKAVAVLAVSAVAALWQSRRGEKAPDESGHSSSANMRPVRVKLSADPKDSELAIVPIDPSTGFFRVDAIQYASNADEFELMLLPGDYFITARYGERFHEVFRHVPASNEPAGFYATPLWRAQQDGRGAFWELLEIVVPGEDITADMALVSAKENFAAAPAIVSPLQAFGLPRPFYVDPTEFTEAEYERVSGSLPPDSDFVGRDADYPIRVRFDMALRAAERAGKRLPDELEFEYMATAGYTKAFPWGNDVPPEGERLTSFGKAGDPSFDVVSFGGRRVWGLASNVAEWTTSRPRNGPGQNGSWQGEWQDPWARVVRGGSLEVIKEIPFVTAVHRDPLIRAYMKGPSWKRGLGFRCVRSASPRWDPADYSRTDISK